MLTTSKLNHPCAWCRQVIHQGDPVAIDGGGAYHPSCYQPNDLFRVLYGQAEALTKCYNTDEKTLKQIVFEFEHSQRAMQHYKVFVGNNTIVGRYYRDQLIELCGTISANYNPFRGEVIPLISRVHETRQQIKEQEEQIKLAKLRINLEQQPESEMAENDLLTMIWNMGSLRYMGHQQIIMARRLCRHFGQTILLKIAKPAPQTTQTATV